MAHAGTDAGNDGTIDSLYGDFSDPMGSSRAWHLFKSNHIDQMGWYAGIDGAVVNLTASGGYDLAAIGLELSWWASTDDRPGVAGYSLIRGGVSIGQATGSSSRDSVTVRGKTYVDRVQARRRPVTAVRSPTRSR